MALVDQAYNNGGGPTMMVDPSLGRVKPNGTNGISRLTQMQARFQQKQLQEKEQKLLRLYENQQQRAFQRVGRGSAGSSSVSSTTSSTTSSSSLGNGKVRQLFDERRTTQTKNTSYKTPGWDRSYPLEPLDNAKYRQPRSNGHEKLSRGASLERINTQPIKKIVSRSRSQARPGNLVNGGYVERSRHSAEDYDEDYNNYYHDEVGAAYYHRDRNANRYTSQEKDLEQLFAKSRIYDEEPLRDGETFDDSQLFKKLTNVGGILLMKERTMNEDKYKTYNANNKRMPATEASQRTTQQPLRRRDNDVPQRASPAAVQARTAMKPTARNQEPALSPPPSNGPLARRQVPAKETSSPTLRTASSTNTKASAPAPSVATSRSTSFKVTQPTAPYKAATSRPSPRAAPVQDNLTECNFCGRRFASDRVAMHQDICARTGQKKRKVFDPVKQRVKGTEAEAYVKNAIKQKQPAKAEAPKKSDWRRKHEEFIAAIRAAKEVKAHLAAGGKLSDLPPPPPSENLDYIQCQHCNRRFNQAAAERHIPRCADMQHNKPKAKAPAAKGGGAIAKKR